MKKTLLTLGIAFLAGTVALAQSISVKEIGTSTDISGTTVLLSATSSSMLVADYDVFNESSTSDNFIVTRRIMSQPATWENEVCWGDAGFGQCYPNNASNVWVTPSSVNLAQGQYGSFTLHINPFSAFNDYAWYRYYFGTAANPTMDSLDVVVNQALTVKEIKKDISMSVSPNPSSEYVNIKVSNFEKGNMKIVDVLGNVVKSESFNGFKSVDVSEFRNGVYFIVITGDGVNTINRKLVVKH